ncbi:endonuclease [Aquabacter cavernae]|uniref:endonuclease n=1 Tax=Aquabacter cavernae TaxID=2496029 RepID=UPI000F8D7B74|nr:endonuclease [Aquabacter cavernae]
MRKVNRMSVPVPASLMGATSPGPKELDRARHHFRPSTDTDAAAPAPKASASFTFSAYKGDDVRHALETLFHGKCAYCEARYEVSGPVDVEHFRPKKGLDRDKAHSGYWWLAATWTNLLPSCLDCNRRRYQQTPESLSSLSGLLDMQQKKGMRTLRTGKETCFPVSGVRVTGEPAAHEMEIALQREEPLLLDPCSERDDPSQHLRFNIPRRGAGGATEKPIGVVFAAPVGAIGTGALPSYSHEVSKIEDDARAAGISVRGAVSIQVYGLNRLALVQERTRILRRLEFLGDTVITLARTAEELGALKLDDDAALLRDRAVERLEAHAGRTLAEIRQMAAPDAPFSSLSRSWIEAFKTELQPPVPPALP